MYLPTYTCSQEIFFMHVNDACIHLGATAKALESSLTPVCVLYLYPILSVIRLQNTPHLTTSHWLHCFYPSLCRGVLTTSSVVSSFSVPDAVSFPVKISGFFCKNM